MPVRPLRGEASCRPSASLPGVSPPPLSPPGFPAGMKESCDSAVTEKSRERGGASPSLKGEERPELRPVLQLLCPARPTAAGAPMPRGRAPLCPDPPRRSAAALPHSKAPTALPEAVLAEGKKKTTNQQQQQKKEAEKRRICPTFLSGAFPALLTPRWAHRTGAHGRDAALSHEHRGYRPGSTRPRGRGDLLPSISSPLLLISLFLSIPPPRSRSQHCTHRGSAPPARVLQFSSSRDFGSGCACITLFSFTTEGPERREASATLSAVTAQMWGIK